MPRGTDNAQDRDLVGLCLKGDPAAWAALVDRHGCLLRDRLRRIQAKRGTPISEADLDEVVSRVWAELLKDSYAPLRRWDPAVPFERFLTTVALYLWIDLRRSELARKGREARSVPVDPELGSPFLAVERRELRDKVHGVLRLLPGREQFILRALYQAGWSRSRIAQELRISTRQVGPVLEQALQRLRRLLRESGFLMF